MSDLEKGGTFAPLEGTTSSNLSFTPDTNRPKPLSRPSGRALHIAHTPAEINPLRRRLSTLDPDENFDIVIQGSAEHINALRETHTHHAQKRDELKAKFGQDFEELERVVTELNHLSSELNNVSNQAMNMDANFDKYGYSAHIRTLPGSGDRSETTSLSGSTRDYDSERNRGEFLKFFKMPVVRQYNHKGLLWRASETAEVASYELFFDLLYVGILAITGDSAVEAANAEGFLLFAVTFLMAWKLWSDLSQALSWIVMDDIVRRISILFMMVILLGLVTNIAGFFEETYAPLVAFYLAGRWYCGIYFIWMGYLIPMVRNAMIGSAIACFIPGPLWIGSIHVEGMTKQALIWPALALDILGPVMVVYIETGILFPPKLREKVREIFEFTPGNNIEHKIERTNALVAVVFGYSVVNISYQSGVAFGINAYFGKAILGLIQTFAFSWLYFELDVFNMHAHAIRRSFFSAFIWLMTHLPFVLSFTLSSAALARVVVAHDSPESELEQLFEISAAKSEGEISLAIWLFYCVGLGIALICTGFIAASHRVKAIPSVRLTKNLRVGFRLFVGVIICLLPLARHHLDSLTLVAITSSLVSLVLLVELIGSTCVGHGFWGFNDKNLCTYSANAKMSRKEIEEKLQTGDVINVEELANRPKNKGNHDEIVI